MHPDDDMNNVDCDKSSCNMHGVIIKILDPNLNEIAVLTQSIKTRRAFVLVPEFLWW